MKTFFIATAALLASTAAFAAEPVDKDKPPVPAVNVPAATATAPEGCKFVQVYRPGVNPARADIQLTLRGYGSDVQAIEACNPASARSAGSVNVIGVASSPTAGARVSVRTKGGSGVVGLPTILADGNVSQVVCGRNGRKITFDLYKLAWSGGLPERLELVEKTAEIAGDADYYRGDCYDKAPPQVKAQLDDPSKKNN